MRVLRPTEAHKPGTAVALNFDYESDAWCFPVAAGDDERTDADCMRFVIEVGPDTTEAVTRAYSFLDEFVERARGNVVASNEPTLAAACHGFLGVEDALDLQWTRFDTCQACGWNRDQHEATA